MDKTHFLQLLQQRLRTPVHFEFPDGLRPAIDALAQSIQDLPIAPEMRGGLLGGLLNVCEYIDQACRHFVPPVAPPDPVAELPPAEPVEPVEPVEPESAETPAADSAPPSATEPVTGEVTEPAAEQPSA